MRTQDATGVERLVQRVVSGSCRKPETKAPLGRAELLGLYCAEPRHQGVWAAVNSSCEALIVKSQLRNGAQRPDPIAFVQISVCSGVISPCG